MSTKSYAAEETISLWYFEKDARFHYRHELLQLALSYTENQTPKIVLKPVPGDIEGLRAHEKFMSGDQPVVASALSRKEVIDEYGYQIKPSILAGMLGFRLFLVRQDKIAYLSQLQSEGKFRAKAVAGFGAQWQDLEILQKNQIKVKTTLKYQGLFAMLASGRFDYFPRGVSEIFRELSDSPLHEVFSIYPKMAMYYPYPVHFYVHKKYQALGERIEYGLEQAIKDGSFKRLFQCYHRESIEWLSKNDLDVMRLVGEDEKSPAIENMSWWLPPHLAHKIAFKNN